MTRTMRSSRRMSLGAQCQRGGAGGGSLRSKDKEKRASTRRKKAKPQWRQRRRDDDQRKMNKGMHNEEKVMGSARRLGALFPASSLPPPPPSYPSTAHLAIPVHHAPLIVDHHERIIHLGPFPTLLDDLFVIARLSTRQLVYTHDDPRPDLFCELGQAVRESMRGERLRERITRRLRGRDEIARFGQETDAGLRFLHCPTDDGATDGEVVGDVGGGGDLADGCAAAARGGGHHRAVRGWCKGRHSIVVEEAMWRDEQWES